MQQHKHEKEKAKYGSDEKSKAGGNKENHEDGKFQRRKKK